MPRPPILPVLDWKEIFDNGKTWEEWLDSAENPDQARDMRERYDRYSVPDICNAQLGKISRPVYVIAIAEDWCGDVIKHAPVVAKLADASPQVQLRFISREDRPDVFVRFLTNGGEAIPKFIFLSNDFVECGNWGPMPSECRRYIARGKAMGNVKAAREKVREFYQADANCNSAFKELADLIDLASATEV